MAGDRRRAAGSGGGSRVHQRRGLVRAVNVVGLVGEGRGQVRTEEEEACEMIQVPESATPFSTEMPPQMNWLHRAISTPRRLRLRSKC